MELAPQLNYLGYSMEYFHYKVNPTWTGKILLSPRPKLGMSANSIITLIELVGIEPTFWWLKVICIHRYTKVPCNARGKTWTYNKNSFNISLYRLSYPSLLDTRYLFLGASSNFLNFLYLTNVDNPTFKNYAAYLKILFPYLILCLVL